MNYVKLRRIALSMASVSFSALLMLCMLWINVIDSDADTEKRTPSEKTGSIVLPEGISCTPLVVQEIASYDGKFIEDGSGREVLNVAAILLYNSSDKIVPYANVTVYTQNCKYTFEAFMLPPESTVLVPDSEGKTLTEKEITRIFGWVTVKPNEYRPHVTVTERENGCLEVQNLSGNRIHDLKLYHRTYISETGVYMGGKAFFTEITEVPPGETVQLYPANYAPGYSKVICFE